MTHEGPIVIAYDRSSPARSALHATGELASGRDALVIVVWKPGLGFELDDLPAATAALPPAGLDMRAVIDDDVGLFEGARRVAEEGARALRRAGMRAQGVAVVDHIDVPVAGTIVAVAADSDAPAIVIGAHRRDDEVQLGTTGREVLRRAGRPVLTVPPRYAAAGSP